MRTWFLSLVLALPVGSQVITQPFPNVPAVTSVTASEGDQATCAVTVVSGTVPAFRLVCVRAGITVLNAITIRASGTFSSGDLAWSFTWDGTNPRLVHVQASGNVRDPAVFAAWLNYGTVTGEFQVGERVQNPAGDKTATVTHWTHTTGTMLVDGVAQTTYGSQIALGNVAGAFALNETIIGSASGATGAIGGISPVTSNKLKSAVDVEWPAAAPGFFSRILRGTK